MEVLCFDVASGGVSGARIDENLKIGRQAEAPWDFADLDAAVLRAGFESVYARLITGDPPAAICVSSFMHGFLVIDPAGNPRSRVSTWMDNADAAGVERIRRRMGDLFHQRTGCRYHPMFPVFKVAAIKVNPGERVVSPKAWLAGGMAGVWVEDYGIASASGMLNLASGAWDEDIVGALDLPPGALPPVIDREAVIGAFHGIPVINGTADGFLATLGSACYSPGRIAATIGTTASARTTTGSPTTNASSGTFCYRAGRDSFLLGCASNNGGNVLDWARGMFGDAGQGSGAVPIFLPTMHGERSPDWNADLRASWMDVDPTVSRAGLKQSVFEGVVFNLAHYVEILETASGRTADQVVVSGNGFLEPSLAPTLAALVRGEVVQPPAFGLATLRGAAVTAWRALGHDTTPILEEMVAGSPRIAPASDASLPERFARYRQLRLGAMDL